jgi:hypothetical protein
MQGFGSQESQCKREHESSHAGAEHSPLAPRPQQEAPRLAAFYNSWLGEIRHHYALSQLLRSSYHCFDLLLFFQEGPGLRSFTRAAPIPLRDTR